MKRSLALLPLIIGLLLPTVPAGAETLSVSQKIYIRAVVVPTRTVIVNNEGKIIEIDSNTTQDVTPDVYLDNAASGKKLVLLPDIYKQYRKLLQANAGAGVLYKAKVDQAAIGTKLILTTGLI